MKALIDTADGRRTTIPTTVADVERWLEERTVTVGELGNGFVAIPFETITRIDVPAALPETPA